MDPPSNALQFQFEVVAGAVVSMQVVRNLLRMCQDEDLQPLTISSLESFGQWLSVDSVRLNQGEDALAAALKPNNIVRFASKIILGTENGGIVDTVGKSVHLTASFLFIAACNAMNAEKTAELIHELLRLIGAVNRNGTPRFEVSKFVERVRGYRDYIPGETPSFLFAGIAEDIGSANFGLWEGNEQIINQPDPVDTAKLLHEVFTALADTNIKHVILKGNRGFVWIASLLSWLRPRDVVIIGPQNAQIYPRTRHTDDEGQDRVCIIFENENTHWSIEQWVSVPGERIQESILDFCGPSPDYTALDNIKNREHYPLKAVKGLMMWKVPGPSSLQAIGLLASAMVIVATEQGLVTIPGGTRIPLKEICSEWYLNHYTDLTWLRDPNGLRSPPLRFRLLSEEILKALDDRIPGYLRVWDDDVIWCAVQVAAAGLALSLCEELPVNAQYKDIGQRRGEGYVAHTPLLDERKGFTTNRRAVASISFQPGILRLKGTSTAFRHISNGTFSQRDVNKLHGYSIPVELFRDSGHYQPLTESFAHDDGKTSVDHLIRTYNDELVMATVVVRPHHTLEDKLKREEPILLKLHTLWKDSIITIIGAAHVENDTSRYSQLEQLAKKWRASGKIAPGGLELRPVGDFGEQWAKRSIIRTAGNGNETLRFFAAGLAFRMTFWPHLRSSISPDRKVFIRQGPVSLMHCMKEAMEQCSDDEGWVIIA
ncbi:hypothetical protein HD806DRAFT_548044 [Xylariaceae sp. AK1471]|nr:hypothetical protein HD806DRAFT_548044 [Xylariaceae sp. AK1471]